MEHRRRYTGPGNPGRGRTWRSWGTREAGRSVRSTVRVGRRCTGCCWPWWCSTVSGPIATSLSWNLGSFLAFRNSSYRHRRGRVLAGPAGRHRRAFPGQHPRRPAIRQQLAISGGSPDLDESGPRGAPIGLAGDGRPMFAAAVLPALAPRVGTPTTSRSPRLAGHAGPLGRRGRGPRAHRPAAQAAGDGAAAPQRGRKRRDVVARAAAPGPAGRAHRSASAWRSSSSSSGRTRCCSTPRRSSATRA